MVTPISPNRNFLKIDPSQNERCFDNIAASESGKTSFSGSQPSKPSYIVMLYTIVVVLLILWLLGAFVVPMGGSLIHLLLVVALVVLVFQLLTGRRV